MWSTIFQNANLVVLIGVKQCSRVQKSSSVFLPSNSILIRITKWKLLVRDDQWPYQVAPTQACSRWHDYYSCLTDEPFFTVLSTANIILSLSNKGIAMPTFEAQQLKYDCLFTTKSHEHRRLRASWRENLKHLSYGLQRKPLKVPGEAI